MNPLQSTLIEKTGHDYGFEYVPDETDKAVTLASARHPVQIQVTMSGEKFRVEFVKSTALLRSELARSFDVGNDNTVICNDVEHLACLMKRASSLGHSLPNQAEDDFEVDVKNELDQLPTSIRGTEIERMVRQRVGQQTYRKAMLAYWGSACAVTGITITSVLRASHAKPWADCESDAARLDVFNGFLLSANLDALFDKFLITFNDEGEIIVNPNISHDDQQKLGLDIDMKLRWLAPEHLNYLEYHRRKYNMS